VVDPSRFEGLTVTVLGDVMVDEYVWGDVHRISPEAPVPVVDVTHTSVVPGGAANAARGIAALGGRVHLIGVVGGDEGAERLGRGLDDIGVDASGMVRVDGSGLIRVASRPTTTKTRIVAAGQHVVRADHESRSPLDRATEDELIALALDRTRRSAALVVSDYLKGVVSVRVAQAVITEVRGRIPVVVDPKGSDPSKYRSATVITPNTAEARILTGLPLDDEPEQVEAGRALSRALGGTAVVLTRGPAGMLLIEGTAADPVHIPTRAETVFDVTGAGDTVVSVIALALASGSALRAAAEAATAAAGIVVGKVGTASVSRSELSAALAETPG